MSDTQSRLELLTQLENGQLLPSDLDTMKSYFREVRLNLLYHNGGDETVMRSVEVPLGINTCQAPRFRTQCAIALHTAHLKGLLLDLR